MTTERRAGWRAQIDVATTIAMIVAAGASLAAVGTWYINRPPKPVIGAEDMLPSEMLDFSSLPTLGDAKSAPVGLVVYADFECESCGEFARDVLPLLVKEYIEPGKLVVAYRHFPYARLHRFAVPAAQAAVCASEQGGFWRMHDAIFSKQSDLTRTRLRLHAKTLGLDDDRFAQCMNGPTRAQIVEDAGSGLLLGVFGTPTLIFGTIDAPNKLKSRKRTNGVPSVDVIRDTINGLGEKERRGR